LEAAAIREADRISELFDREESERQPPYGRALDLGCSTGMQSVALARRGWQVTGIEIAPRALRAARERARQAGVEVRLVEARSRRSGPPAWAPALALSWTSGVSTA
jgi:methylase of polypeptide subunit release factors